jgi:thiosulfate/3-mercaptopyruvate sulfurtransferase
MLSIGVATPYGTGEMAQAPSLGRPLHWRMFPWIRAEALLELPTSNLRLVDVRFSLADPQAGRRAYSEGHLPGALYLDLDADLSVPAARDGGRHPLPDPESFAARLGQLGIGNEHHVVVYDDGSGLITGRLWWMLRWLGHEQVQVLEGGIGAYVAAGGELSAAALPYPQARFDSRVRHGVSVDRAWLRERLHAPTLTLLDARMPERYRGEVEPIDPRPGRIPGALNLPFNAHLQAGFLRPQAELEALVAPLRGAEELVVYCGSGVSAAQTLMLLEAMGLEGAKLYPGSYSDWVGDDANPVELG